MQPNQRTRFVLLLAVITLALTGATVSTTTGGLTDEEVVTLGEVEADWNESMSTDDEVQPNETSEDNGTESDSNGTNSDEMSGNEIEPEANESGNQTEAGDTVGDGSDNDGTVTTDSSQDVSTTESNGQDTNETAPNASTRR